MIVVFVLCNIIWVLALLGGFAGMQDKLFGNPLFSGLATACSVLWSIFVIGWDNVQAGYLAYLIFTVL
jgi:hypothetical protein